MKTPSERGPIGAWAYEARQDADLSVEEVAERLTRLGQPVTPPTLRGIESGGKKPSRRLLRALATVYDRPVPGPPQEPAPDSAHTEGAGSLAEAIRELTKELQAAREERAATARRLDEVEAVLRTLVAPAMTTGAAPAPHPPTTG